MPASISRSAARPLPHAAPGVVRAPVREGDRQKLGIGGLKRPDLLGDAGGVEEADARLRGAGRPAGVARPLRRQIAGEDRNPQRNFAAGQLDQERPIRLRVVSPGANEPDALALERPQRVLEPGDAVVEAVVVRHRNGGNVVAGQVKGRLHDIPPMDEGFGAFERRRFEIGQGCLEVRDAEIGGGQDAAHAAPRVVVGAGLQDVLLTPALAGCLVALAEAGVAEEEQVEARAGAARARRQENAVRRGRRRLRNSRGFGWQRGQPAWLREAPQRRAAPRCRHLPTCRRCRSMDASSVQTSPTSP